MIKYNKTNLRDLIAGTGLVILLKIVFKLSIFGLCNLEQGKSEGFDSCDRPSNLTQVGFKSSIFQPV